MCPNFIEYKARIPIQCTSVLLIVQENSKLKIILIIDVKIKKYNKRGNVENKNVLHEGGAGHCK